MAYIGVQPAAGQYRKLDDISAGFNGTSTTFTTSVSGESVTAGTAQQLLVSIGGVIQEPKTDYDVSTNSIVFTTAPAAGLDFFAVLMGDAVNTITVPDGSVTTAKLAGSLSVGLAGGTNSAPTLFFTGDTNTGVYSPGADQVAVTTGGTQRLLIDASGNVNVDSNTLYVDAANNRVGIGTTSPSSLLHLSVATAASDGTKGVRISNPVGTIAIFECGANNDSYVGTTSNSDFSIRTNNTSRIYVTNGGNVGIGTTSPSSLIHAVGTAANLILDRTSDSPAVVFKSNGTNIAGISTNNSNIRFEIGSGLTEAARIDSSGRLGIGTTSPDVKLHVAMGNGTGYIKLDGGTSSQATTGILFRSDTNNYQSEVSSYQGNLQFVTGANERARIDSSGRLLVGTSTARANFFNGAFSPGFQLEGTTVTNSSNRFASLVFGDGSSPGPIIALGKHRSSSIGGTTVVASGDEMGQISFQGSDGTEFVEGANIRAEVDGTPGANDMPGRLVFSTTADGASSPTEAMRINNQREVLIGTNTRTANGGVLQVSNGITFPATQSACSDANTLDDYEEGTWTPTIIGTSSAGTTTYTRQDGTYTKIGRLVTVSAWVSASATTGTGSLTIGGLPFSQQSTYYAPGALMVSDYNWSTGSYLTILVPPGANRCDIYASADDASWQLQNITNEVQQFMFTITYVV